MLNKRGFSVEAVIALVVFIVVAFFAYNAIKDNSDSSNLSSSNSNSAGSTSAGSESTNPSSQGSYGGEYEDGEDGNSLSSTTPTTQNTSGSTQNTNPSSTVSGSVVLDNTEIAKHNNQNDCWLLVDSTNSADVLYGKRVYAIPSNFIFNIHPGGAQAILNRCGTDATNYFLGSAGGHVHRSGTSHNLLNGFFIGNYGDTITWP